jgi:hypothetical protein
MFCPKCATQNLDGASFCRSCGANISLIPQALAGQVPQYDETDTSRAARRARKRGKELSLDHSFKNIFMGVAFLIVAIALSRSIGAGWWFWMLLPAFSMMFTGVAQYIRIKEREKKTMMVAPPATAAFTDRGAHNTPRNIPAPRTGELMPPVPSVTEGTTRHLGVEAPTRHFDADQK